MGGIISGSLALLSDSLHNFGDSMSLTSSYIALRIGEREKNEKYTFGYRRAEILVAFINSSAIIGVGIFLLVESYRRFMEPVEIKGFIMLVVAVVGLIANLLSIILLHTHAKESMNIRSAYLHLLSDTFSSVAVVIGAVAIILWKVNWIDLVITVILSLYIIKEGFEILRESVEVLMEASPDLNLGKIRKEIESIEGVKNAHHFHAWRIGEKDIHFECHIEVENMRVSDAQKIIEKIEEKLKKFGITHTTIQVECGKCDEKSIVCK